MLLSVEFDVGVTILLSVMLLDSGVVILVSIGAVVLVSVELISAGAVVFVPVEWEVTFLGITIRLQVSDTQ
jgi:hypothetical protein